MKVTGAQVLAFRVAQHHLGERVGGTATAVFAGLQDTPPGAAATALAARTDLGPEALDELVIVPGVRGAPLAVAPADLPVFTDGLAPPDERAARTQLGSATRTLEGMSALDALDLVSTAVRDSLAAGPLARDDFHQALRERVPDGLLLWCPSCRSRHVHSSLWRATGVRGVLAIVGREGRAAVFGAPPSAPSVTDPGAELARRVLRAYGPTRARLMALWPGTTTAHAQALMDRAGELTAVEVEGTTGWVLAEDAGRLAEPPPASGVRLLGNLDPLLTARDRELLVPDAALRKALWIGLGGPGVVLAAGRVAGTWRTAARGDVLTVTVTPLGRLAAAARTAVAEEAARLAPFRDCARAEVAWT